MDARSTACTVTDHGNNPAVGSRNLVADRCTQRPAQTAGRADAKMAPWVRIIEKIEG